MTVNEDLLWRQWSPHPKGARSLLFAPNRSLLFKHLTPAVHVPRQGLR